MSAEQYRRRNADTAPGSVPNIAYLDQHPRLYHLFDELRSLEVTGTSMDLPEQGWRDLYAHTMHEGLSPEEEMMAFRIFDAEVARQIRMRLQDPLSRSAVMKVQELVDMFTFSDEGVRSELLRDISMRLKGSYV